MRKRGFAQTLGAITALLTPNEERDGMVATREVWVPERTEIDTSLGGNRIRQLASAATTITGTSTPWQWRRRTGELLLDPSGSSTLLTSSPVRPSGGINAVLLVDSHALATLPTDAHATIDALNGKWLFPITNGAKPTTDDEWQARRQAVRDSWIDRLDFREEVRDPTGTTVVWGLRTPQIGALHSILAHWTVSQEPATIVMPTGTGKTETMLATLLRVRPGCLLVVVPTDALRDQVSRKFLSLGVLPSLGVLNGPLLHPIVGTLRKRLSTPEEVRAYFSRCNVVVTTMAVAGTCSDAVQKAMASAATHLIIDEAHHISAHTWASFRSIFSHRPILQFTATPFRRDRKHVDGRIIYNYPLRKAQQEGLFQRVNFLPLFEYGDIADSDRAIAERTIATLESDLQAGFDHLAMARCDTIDRAEAVVEHYRAVANERASHQPLPLGPVLVHSRMSRVQRRAAMATLAARQARVVVCVDMFGEGFDMPALKIAALHDVHKSLAITLQFVGRFTRPLPTLGEATVIVNLGRAQAEDSLRALYAEDADWNVVLRDLSTGASAKQVQRSDFLKKFDPPPTTIPLQNVSPAMSTVVYRVQCSDWRPDRISDTVGEDRLHGAPSVNHIDKVAVFVTREVSDIDWGDIREIADITWDLYIVHWDPTSQLLYICSSNNASLHRELAEAVSGVDSVLIRGEAMFRVFHNVRRLILLNLGLRHAIGRNIQFTMYVGADVLENLPGVAQANKIKSNMFGHGHEHGSRASYGCSYKGRVWSHKRATDIVEWMEWVHSVGGKLQDTSIDTAAALRYALIPKRAISRPASVPCAVQWPYEFLVRDEELVTFQFVSERATLLDVDISVVTFSDSGPLELRVSTATEEAIYEITFSDSGVEYEHRGGSDVQVTIGRRQRSLSAVFKESDPPVFFADGSSLRGDALLLLPKDYVPPFGPERVEVGSWNNIAITKESQGLSKDSDTVQRRVIEEAIARAVHPFDIIYDDDASGESADVVTLRLDGDRIFVQLIHCKFSSKDYPGSRVGDLYEVCGQAQRSAYWKGDIARLLTHLDRRESDRMKKGGPSRFEKGDISVLRDMRRRVDALEPTVEIVVVQPGLSKSKASADQLELLAVTELYLNETYRVPLRVVGSA